MFINKPVEGIKEKLKEVSSDPDVQLLVDLLEKCLVLAPDKRITVPEALQHPFIKS